MKINIIELIEEAVRDPRYNPSMDTIENYFELYDMELASIINDYQANPEGTQPWSFLPFPRIQKIWADFAKTGFVRDEKGIDKVGEMVVDNIIKVAANTFLAGHTEGDPESWLREEFPEDADEFDWDGLYEYITDPAGGHIRMSDYAMDDLEQDAARILESESAEDKLVNIDRALNRIHMRSDIAGWFLKGGSNDLNKLAGVGDEQG